MMPKERIARSHSSTDGISNPGGQPRAPNSSCWKSDFLASSAFLACRACVRSSRRWERSSMSRFSSRIHSLTSGVFVCFILFSAFWISVEISLLPFSFLAVAEPAAVEAAPAPAGAGLTGAGLAAFAPIAGRTGRAFGVFAPFSAASAPEVECAKVWAAAWAASCGSRQTGAKSARATPPFAELKCIRSALPDCACSRTEQ
mmetsp:Transcript_123869/g.396588  ORF Transcript_123869/g.396588 Transcript_123869/m.396588 type:complete len:201 (+) Transcript_123869:727-1329(+)